MFAPKFSFEQEQQTGARANGALVENGHRMAGYLLAKGQQG